MAENTRDQIMEATCNAMCRHGYADLTIEKIAEEFEKGKSSIYYHFDDKEELMLEFLEDILQEFRQDIEKNEDPEKRLEFFLEKALPAEDRGMWNFRTAILEMRAQAPYSEEFAEKFEELDRLVQKHLETILEEKGVENAEEKALVILSVIEGAVDRSIASQNQEDLEKIRSWIKDFCRIKKQ